MATTDYELMYQVDAQIPHTFNSLQQLVMRMADFNKHKNKRTWWGKNKARKAWQRVEGEIRNTITSMFLDKIIECNASSDEVRENIYKCIVTFSAVFPNWQDSYSFAEELFVHSPDKANQLIEALRH